MPSDDQDNISHLGLKIGIVFGGLLGAFLPEMMPVGHLTTPPVVVFFMIIGCVLGGIVGLIVGAFVPDILSSIEKSVRTLLDIPRSLSQAILSLFRFLGSYWWVIVALLIGYLVASRSGG
ncbi:hypothetical protein [uncultured Tateyamaria sp.]|uniref:hypothetical protein n=1 Tax=uncultured Tateyamaria sp. TaxID=455651 RepID=UPI0026165F19|nr:hypothetical protein [uncultured Tateyamaria sp.]